MRRLINKVLNRFGYRLVRVRPGRFKLNPRFDREDLQHILTVIKRGAPSSGEITWAQARKYLRPRRVSFYCDVVDVLEEQQLPLDHARVLDVGASFGYLLRLLHKRHPDASYHGTDTNETRIALARKICPFADIWQGTIDTLNSDGTLENEKLDASRQGSSSRVSVGECGRRQQSARTYSLVFLTEVFEHLVAPETSLHKLVQMTDTLFLTVPDGRYDTSEAREYRPERHSYMGHINFWSAESWSHWLRRELPHHRVHTGKLPSGQLYAVVQSGHSHGGD